MGSAPATLCEAKLAAGAGQGLGQSLLWLVKPSSAALLVCEHGSPTSLSRTGACVQDPCCGLSPKALRKWRLSRLPCVPCAGEGRQPANEAQQLLGSEQCGWPHSPRFLLGLSQEGPALAWSALVSGGTATIPSVKTGNSLRERSLPQDRGVLDTKWQRQGRG